ESGAVQDLVGVGVADAAQQPWIGQRALERVVLVLERGPERRGVGGEHVDPARIVLAQRPLALHEVDRRPALGAGLGQHERSALELECGQPLLAGASRARRFPVQTPGDHQMDHEEEIALERKDDPLADAPDARDLAPVSRCQAAAPPSAGRRDGAASRARDAPRRREAPARGGRLRRRAARASGGMVPSAAMDAYRAVVDKRDQRAFLPKPLPDESLRRILQAGRMTGSSKNSEPNRLVVVRDRERLRALAGLSRFARWLADAAVVVVIAQTQPHEFDAGRCAQNMMVAAWNDGIGSCPAPPPEADLGKALGIPAGVVINRVIGFGYVDPGHAAAPPSVARRRLPLDTLVHWETW